MLPLLALFTFLIGSASQVILLAGVSRVGAGLFMVFFLLCLVSMWERPQQRGLTTLAVLNVVMMLLTIL